MGLLRDLNGHLLSNSLHSGMVRAGFRSCFNLQIVSYTLTGFQSEDFSELNVRLGEKYPTPR